MFEELIGKTVERADIGEYSITLYFESGGELDFYVGGQGEVWFTANLEGDYHCANVGGKVVSEIVFDNSDGDPSYAYVKFEDGSELEASSNGKEWHYLNANVST